MSAGALALMGLLPAMTLHSQGTMTSHPVGSRHIAFGLVDFFLFHGPQHCSCIKCPNSLRFECVRCLAPRLLVSQQAMLQNKRQGHGMCLLSLKLQKFKSQARVRCSKLKPSVAEPLQRYTSQGTSARVFLSTCTMTRKTPEQHAGLGLVRLSVGSARATEPFILVVPR